MGRSTGVALVSLTSCLEPDDGASGVEEGEGAASNLVVARDDVHRHIIIGREQIACPLPHHRAKASLVSSEHKRVALEVVPPMGEDERRDGRVLIEPERL